MSLPANEANPLPPAWVGAWRADGASTAELSGSYARFLRRNRPRRSSTNLLAWLVLGSVLGVGLAQGAESGVLPDWFGLAPQQVPQPAPHVAPRPRPTPRQASAPETLPSAAVEPLAVPVNSAVPPKFVRGQAAPMPSANSEQLPEQWQRAARALREQDFSRAQQALLEIESAAPANERDAARLARAQLLASNGRQSEALTLLRELSQRAQSQTVRDKARALLAAPAEIVAPERSSGTGQDTQAP